MPIHQLHPVQRRRQNPEQPPRGFVPLPVRELEGGYTAYTLVSEQGVEDMKKLGEEVARVIIRKLGLADEKATWRKLSDISVGALLAAYQRGATDRPRSNQG